MGGGSGGGGRGGRSGGGGGGGIPTKSEALSLAENPGKLLSRVESSKEPYPIKKDVAEYAAYVVDKGIAQNRNDAYRANVEAMRAKSAYGKANKTYRGIEKYAPYTSAKAREAASSKEEHRLKDVRKKMDAVFSTKGMKLSGLNPYGAKYDIKVT